MVSSIVTSVSIINAGVSETFLAGLPDIQRNTVARQFDSLINAPTPFYLLSIGERLIAIVLHITLAVLVWMAVTGRVRRWWILGAILAPRSGRHRDCSVSKQDGECHRGAGVGVDRHHHPRARGEETLRLHHGAARSRGRAGIVSERRAGHVRSRGNVAHAVGDEAASTARDAHAELDDQG